MTAFNKLLGMMKQAGTLGQAQKEMVSTQLKRHHFKKIQIFCYYFLNQKNSKFLLTMGTDVIVRAAYIHFRVHLV